MSLSSFAAQAAPDAGHPAVTAANGPTKQVHDEPSCKARRDEYARLKTLDGPMLGDVLRGMLLADDRCEATLHAAGTYFSQHPDPAIYEPLQRALEAALEDNHRTLVNELADALGATQDPRAAKYLTHRLLDDQSLPGFSRAGAAVGLARTGSSSARSVLEKLIEDDDPASDGAAEGLGILRSRESVPVLLAALKTNTHLKTQAAEALGRIADPSTEEPLLRHLRAKGSLQRAAVAQALCVLNGPHTVAAFRYESCFDESEHVRYIAVQCLKQRDQRAPCDPASHTASVSGLAQSSAPSSAPSFTDVADSTLTLGNEPRIRRQLDSSDPTVRWLAAQDLASLHLSQSTADLTRAAQAESVDWTKAALREALAATAAGEKGFLARLHSKDPEVRRGATSDLRATRFPGREQLLVERMQDADERVRRIAEGAVGDPGSHDPIIQMAGLRKVLEKRLPLAKDGSLEQAYLKAGLARLDHASARAELTGQPE